MRVVILGLSITSSWGNGHATNYRALLRAFAERGHDVLFLERDVSWYASKRDLPDPPHGTTVLYSDRDELRDHEPEVASADLVIVGSYVPEGVDVAAWVVDAARGVTAFYDMDTPITLAALEEERCEYLTPDLVSRFDAYLSFTGGPTLELLRTRYGAQRALPFPCLVDPAAYPPLDVPLRWDLGYLGTYSADRQPTLDRLLLEAARRRPELRAVVAGPQYPDSIEWPSNVERIEHLPPSEHAAFYAAQRATVNVTRADMVRAGWSPSVRLFESAACAVPVISDRWEGLHAVFPEVLVADDAGDVLAHLDALDGSARRRIGAAARARVLAEHTADHRVDLLERLVDETNGKAPAA